MGKRKPTLEELRDLAADKATGNGPGCCPRCGCRFWRVSTVWRRADGTKVRSVYCNHCKYAKRTVERDERPPEAV